jgi:hypothetical protein
MRTAAQPTYIGCEPVDGLDVVPGAMSTIEPCAICDRLVWVSMATRADAGPHARPICMGHVPADALLLAGQNTVDGVIAYLESTLGQEDGP